MTDRHNIPSEACEWGFTEPPEQVDLQRIWMEAQAASGIMFYSYMEQLYKHAPKTYARLRDWRMSLGCTLINWAYDPHGRFIPNEKEERQTTEPDLACFRDEDPLT